MSTSGITEDSPASQTVNPPYVHSVAFSPSGRLFAAGVGDGSITIHETATQRCVERLWPHTRPVGHIEYPVFVDEGPREHVVASCGNDGKIIVNDCSLDEVPSAPSKSKRKGKAKKASPSDSASAATEVPSAPKDRVLYCIAHGSGPNWFTTTSAIDGSVAVADTTPIITVYSGVASRTQERLCGGSVDVAASTCVPAVDSTS